MNSHNSDKQNDSTIGGQEGRDERADENNEENYEKLNEGLNEESTKMNDENDHEFDQTGAAEAEHPEVRDEGSELTDLLRQASGLVRGKFFAAATAGSSETAARCSVSRSMQWSTRRCRRRNSDL